jgi:hypothetical protein
MSVFLIQFYAWVIVGSVPFPRAGFFPTTICVSDDVFYIAVVTFAYIDHNNTRLLCGSLGSASDKGPGSIPKITHLLVILS